MMQRAVIISAVAHFIVLLLLWQAGLSLSRPAPRSYPRLINATLVARPAGAPGPPSLGQPAAAASNPVAAPPAKEKSVEKKKEPEKVTAKTKPEKTSPAIKPPVAKKQNQPPASGSSTSPGSAGTAKSNSGQARGASGGGGGGLKLDAPDFPFPHYIALVQFRIESKWEAPATGEGNLLATVYFKITRSGEVEDIKLEQSSGSAVFDQAAKRAVYNANPLPPLPDGFSSPTLGVHFDFVAY